jgi:uncharacterized membrane protein
MKSYVEYKRSAIQSLSGKWGSSAIASFITIVITGGAIIPLSLEHVNYVPNIITLLLMPLGWGLSIIFLDVARSKEFNYGVLFDGFKDYVRIFLTLLLQGIYTFLWSLLLIVPGIIKSYSYSMTNFILKDEPDLKYDAAINKSMKLMDGHKMDLFILDLSMIGWFLLSIITIGIGFVFLIPYSYTAHAHFYEDLIANSEKEIVE